jgi:hypothetical protein
MMTPKHPEYEKTDQDPDRREQHGTEDEPGLQNRIELRNQYE